jgi:hypothetical protein
MILGFQENTINLLGQSEARKMSPSSIENQSKGRK